MTDTRRAGVGTAAVRGGGARRLRPRGTPSRLLLAGALAVAAGLAGCSEAPPDGVAGGGAAPVAPAGSAAPAAASSEHPSAVHRGGAASGSAGPGGAAARVAAGEETAVDASPDARRAAFDRGAAFLRAAAIDGAWGVPATPKGPAKRDPGISALVLSALLSRPGGPAPDDAPLVDSATAYLLSLQKPDGGIYLDSNANYTTSLAIEALSLAGGDAHADAIRRAVAFVRRMQFAEDGGEGRVVPPSDPRYGGFGYGSDPTQPDMSNTQFAVDALRAAGVPADDPAFRRLVTFLNRSQNRRENETEGEPREWKDADGGTVIRSADGGAVYRPGDSKAGTLARPDGKRELRSYGSMTYALLKCYIYAGIPRDDGRVRDAVRWIRGHYTWRLNPGFDTPEQGMQGLYYYYATAARALNLLGEGAAGQGNDGRPRDWKTDLGAALLRRQAADGSWSNRTDRWMEGLPAVATAFAMKALAETLR